MERLVELSEALDVVKNEKMKLTAEKDLLFENLKEMGFPTLKKAKAKIKSMADTIEENEERFHELLEEFEEEYADKLCE